ncbi:MAG TPA: YciI family protein [Pyrinomonadaceae bacterium]|nr:YciI family protein [Pyrinomonadaceae bacterium]
MKKTKYLAAVTVGIFLLGIAGNAQSAEKPKNSKYDAELAKKVGADKIGMKTYVLAVLKTGPNDTKVTGKERDEIFKGHFANIQRMANEGKLVVAGPFDDAGGDWRGLFIFNVETIEDAKKLTETDPTIKSGVLIGEYHKWYGSAAMMEVNRIHNTISQSSP